MAQGFLQGWMAVATGSAVVVRRPVRARHVDSPPIGGLSTKNGRRSGPYGETDCR